MPDVQLPSVDEIKAEFEIVIKLGQFFGRICLDSIANLFCASL